jgi:hypothetical protein
VSASLDGDGVERSESRERPLGRKSNAVGGRDAQESQRPVYRLRQPAAVPANFEFVEIARGAIAAARLAAAVARAASDDAHASARLVQSANRKASIALALAIAVGGATLAIVVASLLR